MQPPRSTDGEQVSPQHSRYFNAPADKGVHSKLLIKPFIETKGLSLFSPFAACLLKEES
jgi:hypothetical protein